VKFGLTQDQYQFIFDHVVAPLNKKGAKVFCYGSRARGDHQPFSDLDLMVESPVDLSQELGPLSEFLSNSLFPYKVDLVQFSQFAESYKPGYLTDRKELGQSFN